jgi:UDP-3-O-[3-hydroxymyristoyl] glucosamine N-acyltransferase
VILLFDSSTIQSMKLGEVADALGVDCHGPTDLDITGVAGIEDAGPGQLTFIANAKYAQHARTTKASAILVTPEFATISTATLRTPNPYFAFARAVGLFYQPPKYPAEIHPTAVIDPTAEVGKNAHIGAYAVIGRGAILGDDATLLPHVVIYPGARIGDHFFAHAHAVVREGCQLGNYVLLQNGAVIGGDGFGFARRDDGSWEKIPQSGPVILGDNVELQSNACVDRASVGQTRIASGVKIDNLVQVGHGSAVGENSLLCAQVGLAGSTEVGKQVILAGQVGVAGHCKVGDGVVATAQSGIPSDVPPGSVVSGYPAIDNRQWLRAVACFQRLPELFRRIQRMPTGQNDLLNESDVR